MKLTLETLKLNVLDISINPDVVLKKEEMKVGLTRTKYLGYSQDKKISAVKIRSEYKFVISDRNNRVVFESLVSVKSDSDSDIKKMKNNDFDSLLDAVVHTHEAFKLKDILLSFGIDLGSGLPIGVEFTVSYV